MSFLPPFFTRHTPQDGSHEWTFPTHGMGVTLRFDTIDLSARKGFSQTYSVLAHAAVFCILLLLISSPARYPSRYSGPIRSGKLLEFHPLREASIFGKPSTGSNGGGGENDPRPATKGQLAPFSSMPLAPPRPPQNREEILPVPPAIFDPNAPADVAAVSKLGLPWMMDDTDSAGPGKHHGFGKGDGDTMGDGDGDGAGDGQGHGNQANVLSPPACKYCPDPPYTEEARKAKLQGHVTAEVLIGKDGRALRVRIVKGLGQDLGREDCGDHSLLAFHSRHERQPPAHRDLGHHRNFVSITLNMLVRLGRDMFQG